LWRYPQVGIAIFKPIAQTFVAGGRLVNHFDRQQIEKITAGQTARATLDKAGFSRQRFAGFIVKPQVQFLIDLFVGNFNSFLFHTAQLKFGSLYKKPN